MLDLGAVEYDYPASWSLDSDEDAVEKMESGLNARAIDFAKLGRLYLENGNWNGKQIISKHRVHRPRSDRPPPLPLLKDWKAAGGYYKYMWWGTPTPDGGYYYSARGDLGQLIAVFPDDRLTIVRFGLSVEGVDSWDDAIETVAAKVR